MAQKELNNHISESGRGFFPSGASSANASPGDTLNAASCQTLERWTQLAMPGVLTHRDCENISVYRFKLLGVW